MAVFMFKRYPYRLLYQTKAHFKVQSSSLRHATVNPSRRKRGNETEEMLSLPQDLRPAKNAVPLYKAILRANSLAEILTL